MARFRFKLDPLIDVRRHAEQERQRVVAELERRRTQLEDTLRRQQAFISSGQASQRERLVGSIDVKTLRAHAGTTIQLMRDAERIARELGVVYKTLEDARAELATASAARRAIELLRERRYEAWRRERDRAEDAFIDELGARIAGRERPGVL